MDLLFISKVLLGGAGFYSTVTHQDNFILCTFFSHFQCTIDYVVQILHRVPTPAMLVLVHN